MKFLDIEKSAEELADIVGQKMGRDLILSVTVDKPALPENELHFVKLVNWGYVYFNEAGGLIFKELARLLKSTDSDTAKIFQDGKRDLEALRTVLAHNLPGGSTQNERTRRVADVWFVSNGGDPRSWPECCRSICQTIVTMILSLNACFTRLTELEEDAAPAVARLLETIDKSWPAHIFDEMVEAAALGIRLHGFDSVAYRKIRYEKWRDIAALFASREDAELAIRRHIARELVDMFGSEN